jgi:hypothetical protein
MTAWTTDFAIEELKEHLARFEVQNDGGVTSRKYYNQANHLMYRIGVFKPTPLFEISIADLTPVLIDELRSLDKKSRNYVLKQAVGRIFEDINSRFFHSSVSSLLEVQIIK